MRTYTSCWFSNRCISIILKLKKSNTYLDVEGNASWYPGGTSGMSAYPSTSTCLFQRNDTTHQFLSDGNGDLCGSFRCEL